MGFFMVKRGKEGRWYVFAKIVFFVMIVFRVPKFVADSPRTIGEGMESAAFFGTRRIAVEAACGPSRVRAWVRVGAGTQIRAGKRKRR